MKISYSEYHPPAWAERLHAPPKFKLSLAQTPTPLVSWALPDWPANSEVWIKRDDLTGSTLSGNKVRKLEFLLADALSKGCDTVITCGGLQSNHCRATAIAAAQVGLRSHLLLRTSKPHDPPGFVGNLFLDRLVGVEIHLITPQEYRERESKMQALQASLLALGHKAYIVPEGGSNALGSWGYLEMIRELDIQCAQAGLRFDTIVFACGSGGTAAGIAAGCFLAGRQGRPCAFAVCDDAAYFYAHVQKSLRAWGIEEEAPALLDIVDGYKGLGYAVSHEDELRMIASVAKSTGIFLDPVYSGKTLFGLLQETRLHPERFGKRILFVHTGGLFGLYDKIDQFAALLPPLP